MMRRRNVTLLMLIVVLSLCMSLAAAAWSVSQSTENFLTMSSYRARIIEEYKVPEYVNPSETVTKKVNVKNEGSVDILVRVSVRKMFGRRQPDGSFLEDTSLDPEMIQIVFNDQYWKSRADGWFYYTEILKAGEITAEPLMESYTLAAQTGNEYKGKDAQIIISMESVQAEGNGTELWGVTAAELGIVVPDAPKGESTGVIYRGRADGFLVDAEKTDLFASFKNLLPGCARTQEIVVENQSGEETEIFLRAEATRQSAASKKQLQLVRKLIDHYAQIEIRQNETVLYNGPVSGDSMKQEISLGKFAEGEKKNLTVRLALSPEMDNEYQKLTGKVVWIFAARGEDGRIVAQSAPVTGDISHVGMWAVLLAVSGAAALIALILIKRDGRSEE